MQHFHQRATDAFGFLAADGERLDELLALLQQKSPDVEGRDGGILPGSECQRQASIAGPAAELASIHSGVKSLEKRLLAKSKT